MPCTVITAPWPRLMPPVPLSERATMPGTAIVCSPVPMPSSTCIGTTPHHPVTKKASTPRIGRNMNDTRIAGQ